MLGFYLNNPDNSQEESLRLKIGSHSACDIVIRSYWAAIEDFHAELRLEYFNGLIWYYFKDTSRHGCRVNGMLIKSDEVCVYLQEPYGFSGPGPEIFLSGTIQLSWEQVLTAFEKKVKNCFLDEINTI